MPAETMISCEALTKRFGHLTAVDHVSFAFAKGSIFGFLGHNGVAAGKSTAMRVSCSVPSERLNEPPEPSPGLSAAMPWVSVPQIIWRPEGVREASQNQLHETKCKAFDTRPVLPPFQGGGFVCVTVPRHHAGAFSPGLFSHGRSGHYPAAGKIH
jgi:hypothetical protein